MSRLIDADILENRMAHEAFEKDSDMQKWDSGCWIRYKLFENVLREQPTITPEPHWIPVTERLPKEDGDYLVTFEEGYAEDYGFDPIGIAPFEVDCEGFGIWQEHFDRQTLGSLGSDWVEIKVIAWMPLPEPYKGVTK